LSYEFLFPLDSPVTEISPYLSGLQRCFCHYRHHGAISVASQVLVIVLSPPGRQLWLFTLYNKDEEDDLSPKERKAIRELLKLELEARR